MKEQTAWRACVIGALAVIVIGLITMGQFPTDGAGYDPGLGAPIYAFEMARTQADLIAVFGAIDDPARAGRIAAMDAGNLWDYPFMLAYGLFIALFFVAGAKQSGRKVWLLFGALGVIAAVSDGIENKILLGLTADLENAPYLDLLAYPVWIKFWCLMGAGIGAGLFMMAENDSWLWKLLGAIVALAALGVLAGFWSPTHYAVLMGNGLTICWVLQLVYAARRSWATPA
ncbi:MAG: hypothetical protein ABF335_05585 [Alphaproteobacteria bacterium]